MLEACLGEVAQQGKGTLPDLWHGVLHALEEEAEDVGTANQSLNMAPKTLRHAWEKKGKMKKDNRGGGRVRRRREPTREQIQGHDHELLVRHGTELRVGQSHLCLVQGVSYQSHAPLEHGLTVRQEAGLQSSGHRGEALEEDYTSSVIV